MGETNWFASSSAYKLGKKKKNTILIYKKSPMKWLLYWLYIFKRSLTGICRHATKIWHKIWMNVRKNLNIYTEKNLNLTTKIALLCRNLYQIQSQKNLNFESGHLDFTKFQEKKSEWMAGLVYVKRPDLMMLRHKVCFILRKKISLNF